MPQPERVLTWVWWACEDSMTDDTGTEGQVGHRDDTCGRGGTGRDGRCRCGERTGGRPHRLAVGRLAAGRGRRTASAAAHLHGIAGRRPGQGQESAEVDAPLPRQHAGERAAGYGAKRWARDGGHRREDGAVAPVQGRAGRLDAAPIRTVEAQARQTCVYTEGQCEIAPARNSDGGGIVPRRPVILRVLLPSRTRSIR